MGLVEIVRAAVERPPDDGAAIGELMPPLTAEEFAELEAELPCALPADVRELLAYCSGFRGGRADFVEFASRNGDFGMEDTFPHGAPIAGDGFGNFWLVDLWPSSTVWGPIYYACHDPPVVAYQSADLTEFLRELLAPDAQATMVDQVHDEVVGRIWWENPGVLEHGDCLTSEDGVLRSFAESLGPTFQFIDLRQGGIGSGFSWGRYGPRTVVQRCGELPMFAYEKRKGWLERLLGR